MNYKCYHGEQMRVIAKGGSVQTYVGPRLRLRKRDRDHHWDSYTIQGLRVVIVIRGKDEEK